MQTFTLQQIKDAHAKVKSGADFPAYIRDIKHMGVTRYTTYVSDGHTDYSGADGHEITSPAKYDALAVAGTSNAAEFQRILKEHQQGGSDYPTFCKQSAENGVEKWVVDMDKMTCAYYDKAGEEMLVEQIPQ
jgi:uncharacterized protein YbcV (DUF1398 family)